MPSGWVLCALLAQAAAQGSQDITDVGRVRKGLDAPPQALSDALSQDGLVFRMTIRATGPDKPMWEDWSHVPSYIRPWWKLQHYEFLEQVTPEQFRTGTLYPVGYPVGPIVEWLGKRIGERNRRTRAGKAHDEVRGDLEQFLACRADPSKPGC